MQGNARTAPGAVVAVLALMAAVVLSACVQADEPPVGGLTAGEGGATLRGLVVSDEVFPVSGANVTIERGPSTFTDGEGRFAFHELEPGSLRLHVTAEGYESASQDVSVSAGAVIDVMLTVVGIAGQAPYLSTIIFEGFAACTFSAVYSAGPFPPIGGVPCPLGDRVTGTSVEVEAGWAAGVHEITWQTSEEMIFASSLESNCQTAGQTVGASHCPHLGWGKPPLRAVARINDTDYAAKHAIDGEAMWHAGAHTSYIFASYSGYLREEVNETAYPACAEINRRFNVPEHWGCPFGIGFSTGLRFTMYHTTFYHREPLDLEAFTAIPDQ